jgi:thiamine pyrophosphokinase
MKKCIILANGNSPKKSEISFFKRLGYSTIICADGGANSAAKLKIIPDYIIGDLDSIDSSVLKMFTGKSRIIKIKRQNDTDVEKCLKFAIGKEFEKVILLGATGNRLDHFFCNLGIVLKYYDHLNITMIHEKSILKAYSGKVVLNTIPGETISLYGIDGKTKITSSGLKYPLNKTGLPFGIKESTSNVALRKEVNLKIDGGKIFIIRDLRTLRENGLL